MWTAKMDDVDHSEPAKSRSKLTKRIVDQVEPGGRRTWLWDRDLRGFGIQIEKSGTKTYIVRYRIKGEGRNGRRRYVKIGRHGTVTAEEARLAAKTILGRVAAGEDPAASRERRKQDAADRQDALTFSELALRFLSEHAAIRCKPSTAKNYEILLRIHTIPLIGTCKIDSLTKSDIQKLHTKLSTKPLIANRVLTVISCVYGYAARFGLVPDQFNPARGVERFREEPRERYLTSSELRRLGEALTEAETTGIPWRTDLKNPSSKHLPKNTIYHVQLMDRYAVAAIRLLLFTGARLREILHARWEYIDAERSLIFLPDSKTGRKTIVLNSAALDVIDKLRSDSVSNDRGDPIGYLIRGKLDDCPRADLNKPWRAIRRRADLADVRLHDLRHTFASVGVGASLGLPIVGRLLGHTQPQTTARYAHLDTSPALLAAETIGKNISKSMQRNASTSFQIGPSADDARDLKRN